MLPCRYHTNTFRLEMLGSLFFWSQLIVGEQVMKDCSLSIRFLALLKIILDLTDFIVYHLFFIEHEIHFRE